MPPLPVENSGCNETSDQTSRADTPQSSRSNIVDVGRNSPRIPFDFDSRVQTPITPISVETPKIGTPRISSTPNEMENCLPVRPVSPPNVGTPISPNESESSANVLSSVASRTLTESENDVAVLSVGGAPGLCSVFGIGPTALCNTLTQYGGLFKIIHMNQQCVTTFIHSFTMHHSTHHHIFFLK